jgi:hypothetical protein
VSIRQSKACLGTACYLLIADFLFGLFFQPEYAGTPPKHRLFFNGIHGVMAKAAELIIFK